MATVITRFVPKAVLRKVTYTTYVRLANAKENEGLRMTYHNGTLEIASPTSMFHHEVPSQRLGMIIAAVCSVLKIPCFGAGSATFRRGGEGRYGGVGKEPDQSFYITHADWVLAKQATGDDPDLDAGDLPPDLWIEVDNRASSEGKLPVYAALGVPEVWRYRVKLNRIVFLRRVDDRYVSIKRSLNLPMLTPKLVLTALGEGISESEWDARVRAWVASEFKLGG